jgi:hypothetical protein
MAGKQPSRYLEVEGVQRKVRDDEWRRGSEGEDPGLKEKQRYNRYRDEHEDRDVKVKGTREGPNSRLKEEQARSRGNLSKSQITDDKSFDILPSFSKPRQSEELMRQMLEERMHLVLQMIGIENPEEVSLLAIDKFHREVDKGLKILEKSMKNTSTRQVKDSRTTAYLDKLLTVLELLQIEESESALQLNSREFGNLIEDSLSKLASSNENFMHRNEAEQELNDLRRLLDREQSKVIELQLELEDSKDVIRDYKAQNRQIQDQLVALKSSESASHNDACMNTNQFSPSMPSHEKQFSSTRYGYSSSTSMRSLKSSDLLTLIAKRIKRVSDKNQSNELSGVFSEKKANRLAQDQEDSFSHLIRSFPTKKEFERLFSESTRTEGSSMVDKLEHEFSNVVEKLAHLRHESSQQKFQISQLTTQVKNLEAEIASTRLERDEACRQVTDQLSIIQEAELTIRDIYADFEREAEEKENAEIALKDLLMRNKELEKDVEHRRNRSSEKEQIKIGVISPSLEMLSPTFPDKNLMKGSVKAVAGSVGLEPSDSKASNEGHGLLGDGLRTDDWSSMDERRKNSLRPGSETDKSGWQNEINATQTLLKEELEKRDNQLKELQSKVEILLRQPLDKSVNSHAEEESIIERKSIGKIVGGVLRYSTRFQPETSQLGDTKSQNKSPLDTSRIEKKSVRIVENGDDGGVSIIETGRGSVILHSPEGKHAKELKKTLFQIHPQQDTGSVKERNTVSHQSLKNSTMIERKQSKATSRNSIKPLHLTVNNLDNTISYASRSKSAEKKDKIEEFKKSKRKTQVEDESLYQGFVEDTLAEEVSRRELSVKSRQTKQSNISPFSKKSKKPSKDVDKTKIVRRSTVTEMAQRDKDDSFDSQCSPNAHETKTQGGRPYPKTIGKDYVGLAITGGTTKLRNQPNKNAGLDSTDEKNLAVPREGKEPVQVSSSVIDVKRFGNILGTQSFNLRRKQPREVSETEQSVAKADNWEPATGRLASRIKDFQFINLHKSELFNEDQQDDRGGQGKTGKLSSSFLLKSGLSPI